MESGNEAVGEELLKIEVLAGVRYEAVGFANQLIISQYQHGAIISQLSSRPQACFSGGMLALGAQNAINGQTEHYMELAKEIADTCHFSYQNTGVCEGGREGGREAEREREREKRERGGREGGTETFNISYHLAFSL